MSASTWTDRTRRRLAPSHKNESESPEEERDWIGVDFAHFATRQPSGALLPLLVLALLVALGVASLRIDLIRIRYALARATADETRLIEEQHALIVKKLEGRDPTELATLARERGFRPAHAARSLIDPMPMAHASLSGLERFSLPSVSSAPPTSTDDPANEVIGK